MSGYYSNNPNTAVFRDYSPGPHAGAATETETFAPGSLDSRARNALTLGVLSLVFSVITGLPAIWVGRKAVRHINASEVPLRGRWAAWAGIVLGVLSVLILLGTWTYLHLNAG